jgi:hypothetical protein
MPAIKQQIFMLLLIELPYFVDTAVRATEYKPDIKFQSSLVFAAKVAQTVNYVDLLSLYCV